MESLFFNITDTNYKTTSLLKIENDEIKRVDISNGIVVFQFNLTNRTKDIKLKYIDRMVIFVIAKKGTVSIIDHISNQHKSIKEGSIAIFGSSKQDMQIVVEKSKQSDILVIFVADFFLKRYLTYREYEPVDFIYNQIQNDITLKSITTQPIDALSLYIIDSLSSILPTQSMQSIRAEHKVIEFIIHRFSLLNIDKKELDSTLLSLANRAKNILLKEYTDPPSIKELAHLCATNETKLKKTFKQVYQSTIREYIQKLRLEQANILLKEEDLTVGEVAKMVGYRHQGYFSKLFFETYGVYPVALSKSF